MKKTIKLVTILFAFSVLNHGQELSVSFTKKTFGTDLMKKMNYADCKNDDFDYQFDVNGDFTGNSDRYETKNAADDSEALIYNTYRDGRTEKLNYQIQNNVNSLVTLSSDDQYENNDSFEHATSVYEVGNYSGVKENYSSLSATISQKSSGWGPWKKTYIDKDFYRYDVVVTGTLEVNLKNIPSGCDYDLRLYRMANTKYSSNLEMDFGAYDYSSALSGNKDEQIKISVTPGTYYAAVFAYHDETWNDNARYTLSFEQILDENRENLYYDIRSKKKEDVCALWISDYKPLGYVPMMSQLFNSKIKIENFSTYPFISSLYNNNVQNDIMYECLYVWDLGMRATIYSIMSELIDSFENDFSDYKTFSSVSTRLTDVGLVLSVGSVAVTVFQFAELAASVTAMLSGLGFVITIASAAVSVASKVVGKMMETTYSIQKMELEKYLLNARGSFEISADSTDNEVIMLKSRYHFLKESGNYYVDCSPRINNYGTNKYGKTYIDCFDDFSPVSGTVHGCKSFEELKETM